MLPHCLVLLAEMLGLDLLLQKFTIFEKAKEFPSEQITITYYLYALGIIERAIQQASMPPRAPGRFNTALKQSWSSKPAERLPSCEQTLSGERHERQRQKPV